MSLGVPKWREWRTGEAVTPAGQNVRVTGDEAEDRAERVKYARWLMGENRRLIELGITDCEVRLIAVEDADPIDPSADEDLDFVIERGEMVRTLLSRSENHRRRLTAPS